MYTHVHRYTFDLHMYINIIVSMIIPIKCIYVGLVFNELFCKTYGRFKTIGFGKWVNEVTKRS